MRDDNLIRDLVRLRSRDRVPEEALSRLSSSELAHRPEALVLAIVRGFAEFKSNGYADADIYREIEGRRAQVYGEEPLPADLNLENYTRYRLRLEHPGETALHDPVFAMQAVHCAQKYLQDRYGAEGKPVEMRSMPWVHTALLVYATLHGVVQVIIPVLLFFLTPMGSNGLGTAVPGAIHAATALFLVVASIGFAGRTPWGRVAIRAALVLEIVVPSATVLAFTKDASRVMWPPVLAVNALIAAAFLAYTFGLAGKRKPAVR